MTASQITIVLWTDNPTDPSLASTLGQDAAKQVFRQTGQQTVLASSAVIGMEPSEVYDASLAFDAAPHLMHIDQEDGPAIKDRGVAYVKSSHPVYLFPLAADVVVHTNEGPLRGREGSFIAYDEVSGHVWPVTREYVAAHYITLEESDAIKAGELTAAGNSAIAAYEAAHADAKVAVVDLHRRPTTADDVKSAVAESEGVKQAAAAGVVNQTAPADVDYMSQVQNGAQETVDNTTAAPDVNNA